MTKFFSVACVMAVSLLALVGGCGKTEVVKIPDVAWSEASTTRRDAFMRAMVAAFKSLDDLDVPAVKFDVSKGSDGLPALLIRTEGISNSVDFEEKIAVAIANIALEFRGVGFMNESDNVWRILVPGSVRIPVEGAFDFGFLGKHG